MLALLVALLRRKPQRTDPLASNLRSERSAGRTIFALAVASAVVVLALSIISYVGQRTVFAKSATAPVVRVIGHRWWWEIHYEAEPDKSFITAYEIRLPLV